MKYPCWLILVVQRKDADGWFQRHIDLPFQPFKGLHIVFDDAECDFFEVHLVEYSVKDECFWLHGRDDSHRDCPCKPEDNCCVLGEQCVAWHAEHGWELDRIEKHDEPTSSPDIGQELVR